MVNGHSAILARLRALTRPDAGPDPGLPASLRAAAQDMPPATAAEAALIFDSVPLPLVCAADARPLRVAVVGSFTTRVVAAWLRLLLVADGFAPDVLVCPGTHPHTQLSDPESELARHRPDVTLVLLDDQALLPPDWSPTDFAALRDQLWDRVAAHRHVVAAFAARTGTAVLAHTVPLSLAEQRSAVSFQDRAVLGRLWRETNNKVLAFAELDGVHVLDLDPVVAALPAPLGDDRLRRFAGMAWSAGVELAYATEAATFCRAVAGRPRKVLVLDLDNTLWGGVAADDGIDGIQLGGLYPGNAYLDLQRTARTLRRQGVLLAIASKNEPDVATRVLAEHPAMVLRAEDFVATAIDWRPKDENIRRLARELGLGLDGIVFADDSRFECELVRHGVPEVAVVPLTGDPATFTTTLLRDDHFAVLDVTATDIVRTDLYRARARRHRFAETAETNRDYLAGLGLTVTLRAADEYAVGRLTQLAARTNQFVLVKNAHTDAATRGFLGADDRLLLEFEVDDVFGAEGVVGGFWISTGPDRWLIENLVMSCRVFSRGVERAALHGVAARAAAAGATHLDARLVRTPRNGPAAEFLATAGFVRAGDELRTLPLVPAPDLLPEWIRLDDEGNDRV